MDLQLVVSYTILSTFVFYQTRHVARFRGASEAARALLSLSSAIGGLTSLSLLVYAGFAVAWWAPFALFALALVLQALLVFPLELIILGQNGQLLISLLGFIGWPLSAFWMYLTLR